VEKNHDSKALLWEKAIGVRSGILLLIEEVLGAQLLDDIMDVSKLSPESKIYYSSQAFEKLTTQLASCDTSKISKADLIRK